MAQPTLEQMQADSKLRHRQSGKPKLKRNRPKIGAYKNKVKPIEMAKPIQQKPHVPNPPERKITRVPQLEERQVKIERPKALYTNLPSPYGLATEMLMDQLKNG